MRRHHPIRARQSWLHISRGGWIGGDAALRARRDQTTARAGAANQTHRRLHPGRADSAAKLRRDLVEQFSHHLHEPQVLWQTVRQYAKRGTIVFVPDLRRPPSRAKAREFVRKYSGGEPEVLRRDFYNSLLAAFTPAEVRKQLKRAGLQMLKVEIISDRHLLVFGRVK